MSQCTAVALRGEETGSCLRHLKQNENEIEHKRKIETTTIKDTHRIKYIFKEMLMIKNQDKHKMP